MNSLNAFLRGLSSQAQQGAVLPEPDPWDPERLPFAVKPGDNKLSLGICATCAKPPTEARSNIKLKAFLFRDALSAAEYRTSGLCQTCQDKVFGVSGEGEV